MTYTATLEAPVSFTASSRTFRVQSIDYNDAKTVSVSLSGSVMSGASDSCAFTVTIVNSCLSAANLISTAIPDQVYDL